MRAFISRLSAMGDVVCSLPVAAALKATWPDCEVVWAVDRRFRGIVECCGAVDTVTERPSDPRSVREWGEFEFAFDLQGLLKSAVLVGFARAERKLGFHWQREGAQLFSRAVMPDPTSVHIVDQYVDVARAAGAVCDRAEFRLGPKPDDLAKVKDALLERGVSADPFVLVNAGAAWATKRWNPAHYAAMADSLAAAGVRAVFCGAKADGATLDEVKRYGAADAVDMIGATSVRELVALVSLSAVCVGGDTGSTHVAAAMGVPTVGLYTVTRPERSCPYGQIDGCFGPDARPEEVTAAVMARLKP